VFDARAVFLDAHTLDVGGRIVTAKHIVIATGGHPTAPVFAGAEHVIVSDDAFYLPTLPKRVVIIGGGYIGVEFAGIFNGLGAEVHMVMRQHHPLRGFDSDLRAGLAEALEGQGIRLHPGKTILKVDADHTVTLSDGSVIAADLVFAAVGRQANTKGLGLERAGVQTHATGAVVIDDRGRTTAEGIYAIGDVTDRQSLTPVAIAEGHSLADELFGNGPRHWDLNRVATAVFSSPPIGTVGLTEEEAALLGPTDIYVSKFTPMRHALSGRVRKTIMKLVVDQATQRVLGAHMLGEDAPEIVQGLSIAINIGATKADFDRTVGIHPTAAEEFVTMRTRTRVAGVADFETAAAAAE
jgi:glutathione reductase (NADPH)